jgi:hypothetical protein
MTARIASEAPAASSTGQNRHTPVADDEVALRCRNCGVAARGNYCSNCGQETSLALPSAGRFLREAAGRYVAFDGRFWRSIHRLLFRPGVLTRDYLAGRRRRYVRPARLFVGLSIALFALLRFSATTPEIIETSAEEGAGIPVETAAGKPPPSGLRVDTDLGIVFDGATWSPKLAPLRNRLEAFNRLQRKEKVEQLMNGMLRYGPYAAIGLLPVFALLLRVAYAGRTRRHPNRPRLYAAHLVFGAHNHAFLFVATALMVLIDSSAVRATLGVWMVIYVLAAMKTVYGGPWSGLIARALFLAVGYSFFFAVALVALLMAAVALR